MLNSLYALTQSDQTHADYGHLQVPDEMVRASLVMLDKTDDFVVNGALFKFTRPDFTYRAA